MLSRRGHFGALWALGALLLGCGSAPPPAVTAPRETPLVAQPEAPASPVEEAPRLAIHITPQKDGTSIEVIVDAWGSANDLTQWRLPKGDAASLVSIEVTDQAGALSHTEDLAARTMQLDRAPKGSVHVRRLVAASFAEASSEPSVTMDPDKFEADGAALFVLPSAFEERPVPVEITIDVAALGTGGGLAASSFGASATRTVTARGADLRGATFLGGPMGHAVFDAPEGHDEAAWLGFTSFDPRPIAADVAAFRTAANQLFQDDARTLMTLLIVADARPAGTFQVARRTGGVLARVGVGEAWSGPVRIAVATAILHRWVGGQLWIGPETAESYWFSEGITRGLARELLFRFGVLTPTELIAEIEGLTATALTSPLRERDNAALGADPSFPGSVPLLVARGALYAASVDHRLREASGQKTALPDLLRGLLRDARAADAPLPIAAWNEAITKVTKAPEEKRWQEQVGRGLPERLAEGAFGPCFKSRTTRYAAFDLGFDLAATKASSDRALASLRPAGPAARAGLREGDLLVRASLTEGRSDKDAEVVVTRGGVELTKTYKPQGKVAEGQGWARTRDVADDACVK